LSDVTTHAFAGGRYVVERELARGGMATVFLARDRELDRPVAVKVLDAHLAQDDGVADRFRREALTAARLAHRNVVQVYDTGESLGEAFIVMEIVEGEPLDAVLAREGRLPPERVLDLGLQACDALGYAHARGVVHRDVKPANLLLRPDGLLKVTDFGIARALDATTQLTEVGTLLGTASYVAPEQARGEPAGPPADVFSLGVVLYEALTGRPPWPIGSLSELSKVGETPARPAGELAPGTPATLEEAVMHALARNPAYRPPDAHALAGELRGGPATAREPTRSEVATVLLPAPEERPAGRAGSRGGWIVVLVALAVAAAALVAALALGDRDDPPPADEAPARVEPAPARGDPLDQARSYEEWLRENTERPG
jgi:serine/threonine-protein kinase